MSIRKWAGAVALMAGGSAMALAVLEYGLIWWFITVVFAFIGCILLKVFEEER